MPAGQFICGKCCFDIDEAFNVRERILDANHYFATIANEQLPGVDAGTSGSEILSPDTSGGSSCMENEVSVADSVVAVAHSEKAASSKSAVLESEDAGESSSESFGPAFYNQPLKKRLRPKSSCKITWRVKEALETKAGEQTLQPTVNPIEKFVFKCTDQDEVKTFCCFFCPIRFRNYGQVIAHMQMKHKDRVGGEKQRGK